MMAGSATLEVKITGIGGHAAFPERAKNPVVVAAALISALQTVVPQGAAPAKSAVLTITQMHGGDAVAIIPETVTLKGTLRYFEPSIKVKVEREIEKVAAELAKAHSAEIEVNLVPGYPPTINSAQETAISQQVLTQFTDKDLLDFDPAPAMGSEDFAYMLLEKPGCYVWLGNGGEEGGCFLHNPRYDFNDDATAFGATYWVHLVCTYLGTTLSQ
jgi:hippurate hydrolase